jgi:UrcA family protein
VRQQAIIRTFAMAATLAAGVAQASEHEWARDSRPETVTSRVRIGAAELSTAGGRAAVRLRIRREAARLCDGPGGSPLAVTTNGEACRRAVIRSAKQVLDRRMHAEALARRRTAAR